MRVAYSVLDLPTGPAFAAMTPKGLTRLSLRMPALADFVEEIEAEFGVKAVENASSFMSLEDELKGYFAGDPVVFSTKLDVRGTDFQLKVWRALMGVPYGNVRSYKWLSNSIGKPQAARAVGTALGRNKVAIVIPCHRIVGSSGDLCGFASGLDIKKRLLSVEGIPSANISAPA